MRVNTLLQKKNYCCDCGVEISRNAKRCNSCANKNKIQDVIISREELKNLIRNKSFSEIGRLYNVSDNAVRKWCDKYCLPRKKTEIKQYSDKEWEVIKLPLLGTGEQVNSSDFDSDIAGRDTRVPSQVNKVLVNALD